MISAAAEFGRMVLKMIEDPAHWTTGCMARNEVGESTDPSSDEATCFCMMGAAERLVWREQDGGVRIKDRFWSRAVHISYDKHSLGPIDVNDKLGHATVLELVRLTIQSLEQSCPAS